MRKYGRQLLIFCVLVSFVALALPVASTAKVEVSVPATVTVLPANIYAVTALTPALDLQGAAGCRVSILKLVDDQGKDVSWKIKSFKAQLTYDGSRMNVLAVSHQSTFPGTDVINNGGGITQFNGTAPSSVAAPCDLAFLRMRLTGTPKQPVTAKLTLTEIRGDSDVLMTQSIPVPEKSFLRGDAKADGTVNASDAAYILLYLVRVMKVGEGSGKVNPVNAASANPDGKYDAITMADATYIVKYLLSRR